MLDGELTLKGVTKNVPLTLELNGFGPDPFGGTRAGFTATGEINRRDFNVSFGRADGAAAPWWPTRSASSSRSRQSSRSDSQPSLITSRSPGRLRSLPQAAGL